MVCFRLNADIHNLAHIVYTTHNYRPLVDTENEVENKCTPQNLTSFYIVLFTFFWLVDCGLAYGMVSETEFTTSLSEAAGIVRVIVALFGGIICVLGVIVAFRGVAGTADVEMSVSDHGKLSMKRVSQGVVITLIGAGILISALYLLPEKKTERQIKGSEITIEREAGKETIYLEQRTSDDLPRAMDE